MSHASNQLFVHSLNQVDFERSLPQSYRAAFPPEDRERHAQICAERWVGGVSAGLTPSSRPGQSAVCVNADDGVGVLALASAAFATLGLEIQEAIAFSRTPAVGPREVLDVFWVRDPSKILSGSDATAIANLLIEYLAGQEPDLPKPKEMATRSGAMVRFRDERSGTLSILEVETGDRFGLLWEVSNAITGTGVQIVASDIRTQNGRVKDTFTIEEASGMAISGSRRLEIQTAVLSALER